MTTCRILPTAALLSLLGGCAEPGPVQAHRATVGSLKSSVSQLEFQNEQLRKQVAELDSKNREIGDRLVQEEAARDELASRLNDAKNELRGKGIEPGDDTRSVELEESHPQRTLPAGRSSRSKRKAPFARIPGRIETIPPGNTPEDDFEEGGGRSGKERSLELDHHSSRREEADGWLPVARARQSGHATIR